MKHAILTIGALLLGCAVLGSLSMWTEAALYGPPQQLPLVGATVHPADYSRCITIDPGPLPRPRRPVLYPNHSPLS